jgi:hypothetical protein
VDDIRLIVVALADLVRDDLTLRIADTPVSIDIPTGFGLNLVSVQPVHNTPHSADLRQLFQRLHLPAPLVTPHAPTD